MAVVPLPIPRFATQMTLVPLKAQLHRPAPGFACFPGDLISEKAGSRFVRGSSQGLRSPEQGSHPPHLGAHPHLITGEKKDHGAAVPGPVFAKLHLTPSYPSRLGGACSLGGGMRCSRAVVGGWNHVRGLSPSDPTQPLESNEL